MEMAVCGWLLSVIAQIRAIAVTALTITNLNGGQPQLHSADDAATA